MSWPLHVIEREVSTGELTPKETDDGGGDALVLFRLGDLVDFGVRVVLLLLRRERLLGRTGGSGAAVERGR